MIKAHEKNILIVKRKKIIDNLLILNNKLLNENKKLEEKSKNVQLKVNDFQTQ